MSKIPLAILIVVPLGACTDNVMTAPVAVQQATAGQDNRDIILPLAIIAGVTFWGIQ